MMKAIAGDVHPPFFYILLWLGKYITGTGPAGLRLLPAVFSILALVDFHKLTQEMNLTRRAGLLALLVMALLPANIYYAHEGRMYSLLAWLFILQLRLVINRHWLGLGIVTGLALYTHNYAIFYSAWLSFPPETPQ